MKKLLFLLLVSVAVHAQNYTITIFGFPAIHINMEQAPGYLSYRVSTVGFLDAIWPTKNIYTCRFDTAHYGLLATEKKIEQGSSKYTVSGVYDPKTQTLVYNNDIVLQRPLATQTILTILARVQEQDIKEFDTHWLPLEHDGQLYQARLLWADTVTISAADMDILCDYYRLDINAVNTVSSLSEQPDYFMNNIIAKNAVRQIWVEHDGQKRIIQAAVKVYGLKIIVRLNDV